MTVLSGCSASPAPALDLPAGRVGTATTLAPTGTPAVTGPRAPATTSSPSPSRPTSLTVSTPQPALSGFATTSLTSGAAAPLARTGREGSTQRRTFVPMQIRLAPQSQRESVTSVTPVDTAPTGELGLPMDPGVVGWWQSGALAGEAFGSVVLAGHIDSRTQGLGFFVRLLGAQPGDTVDLSNGVLTQAYRVVSNRRVGKTALASGTDSFSQQVPARLVLITCAGTYDRVARQYADNLIVTAEPVGLAATIR